MADPALPCSCTPYENICCCGPKSGISVTQPVCQTLPNGRVVNNPAFVSELNTSFWTYKFLTDCAMSTRGISNFVIPICELINIGHITVFEKIDGCGEFVSVPFTLEETDPNFGSAPEGFVFLKVETDDRFDKGLCVEYRLQIAGNYPNSEQSIFVKAGNNILEFGCPIEACFLVPECNPQGELLVTKECATVISENQANLIYNLSVTNVGNAPLENVLFNDEIFIPGQLSIGTITVDPPSLNVDTSIPGEVIISGNLGTLNPSDTIFISYNIPITNVSAPGHYLINNTATATAQGTEDSTRCNTSLKAVQLAADKCCIIKGNKGIYRISVASVGESPDINVNIFDHLEIPAGITIRFNSFGGCNAFFGGTTDPVPTNTNIVGPVDINIECSNVLVPSGNISIKEITYTLVSSSVVGTVPIVNTLSNVEPVNPDGQIFLGVDNTPVSANIDVTLSQVCQKPCSS